MLALSWPVDKFHICDYGSNFDKETDHKPLTEGSEDSSGNFVTNGLTR